jgi:hypothetical protein
VSANLSTSRLTLVEGALLAADLGAKVINYSWGSKIPFPLEEEMCNILEDKGVLLVCSAGNDGDDTLYYPAAYPTALSVGATDAFDARVPGLSNYGPAVKIAAPGVFLKSCWKDADDDYIAAGFGTSYAAAFVSGAAGLLWSYRPELSVSEMRELLISTGAPTTGFGEYPAPRLDIAAAFEALQQLKISLPPIATLAQNTQLTLLPAVDGEADWLSASLRGTELAHSTAAPWQLDLDLTGLPFGSHELLLQAGNSAGSASLSVPIIVDNSDSGIYPLAEDFESGMLALAALDPKSYNEELLSRIKLQPDAEWSTTQLKANGGGQWQLDASSGFQGTQGAALQLGGQAGYSAWETDLLVSRLLDLGSASSPGLRLRQHRNLQSGKDYLHILATTDEGANLTLLQQRSGGAASYSGYEPNWQTTELDLAPYAGQSLRLVFLLETDASGTGAQTGVPAGCWIDDVELLENWQAIGPSLGSPAIQAWSLQGQVPGTAPLELQLPAGSTAERVFYDLDLAPFGTLSGPDLHIQSTAAAAGFPVSLDIAGLHNAVAILRITPYLGSTPGAMREIPLWLFNDNGDANADGLVNADDLAFINDRLGLTLNDPLWLPFADSDLDGLITEADASAVGYYWKEAN